MPDKSVCPLLDNQSDYIPDTLNLNQDTEAKSYWFDCFVGMVKKFAQQAERSQENDPTAATRAQLFQNDYLQKLHFMEHSYRSESLSIRNLLELNEVYLRLNGFHDPWLEQKQIENKASLSKLKQRLLDLDSLYADEKWIELFRGFLAGNMFDWGAQAISDILEKDAKFGLYDALERIQERPWLIDGVDAWIRRIKQDPPHVCAAIFTDNSGVDIILGVLPFARELLLRDTKVILCANSEPALNDITYNELKDVIQHCCSICEIIKKAYDTEKLLIYGNGQSGPCLDFRNISSELCDAMIEHKTDLLIIEGMGRSLHTNLYAKFNCETLKLAVVKNKWLANRLGGDTFSVICKYENNI